MSSTQIAFPFVALLLSIAEHLVKESGQSCSERKKEKKGKGSPDIGANRRARRVACPFMITQAPREISMKLG